MKNKKSVWSTIILVCTIIFTITFVISVVNYMVTLPTATEAAVNELVRQGYDEELAKSAVSTAMGLTTTLMVLVWTFKVFQSIGGFFFSLKGKWGKFCIVASIIVLVCSVIVLFNNIGQHAGALDIVLNIVDVVLAGLFCAACCMHSKENKQLALEEELAEEE